MQAMLFEIEMFINNSRLTYVYPIDLEACLTPNYLLVSENEIPLT